MALPLGRTPGVVAGGGGPAGSPEHPTTEDPDEEQVDEEQVDEDGEESFPASDPPAHY